MISFISANRLIYVRTVTLLVFLLTAANAFTERIVGEVVRVSDGDTLTLLANEKQHKIQLAEIDAPEKEQPWGYNAKQALSKKVFREIITVDVVDIDRYGRVVGRIWRGERDISRELVAEGHAWVYRQYMTDKNLLNDERDAREQQLGLWSLENPVPPWEWRGVE